MIDQLRLEIIQLTHDAIRARKQGKPVLAMVFLALRVRWIAEVNRLKEAELAKEEAA
jgi:hypothetical protein